MARTSYVRYRERSTRPFLADGIFDPASSILPGRERDVRLQPHILQVYNRIGVRESSDDFHRVA